MTRVLMVEVTEGAEIDIYTDPRVRISATGSWLDAEPTLNDQEERD